MNVPQLDHTRHYLGTLCKRKHNWCNTGLSIRYRGDRTCVTCVGERKDTRVGRTSQWQRNMLITNAIKMERGCADCGYRAHPAALHFDHLPGTTKISEVSTLARRGRADLLAEIAKCEVVCANCHAIRTAERRTSR